MHQEDHEQTREQINQDSATTYNNLYIYIIYQYLCTDSAIKNEQANNTTANSFH